MKPSVGDLVDQLSCFLAQPYSTPYYNLYVPLLFKLNTTAQNKDPLLKLKYCKRCAVALDPASVRATGRTHCCNRLVNKQVLAQWTPDCKLA